MSTLIERVKDAGLPAHVALIMDGNGRWAKARGLPRTAGHQAGAQAAERLIRFAGILQFPWALNGYGCYQIIDIRLIKHAMTTETIPVKPFNGIMYRIQKYPGIGG